MPYVVQILSVVEKLTSNIKQLLIQVDQTDYDFHYVKASFTCMKPFKII